MKIDRTPPSLEVDCVGLGKALALLRGYEPNRRDNIPVRPEYRFPEVLDFLLTRPTPHGILAFKVSDAAQARLQLLLDRNREEALSAPEEAELDIYEQLEHLMILLKARAYALASRPWVVLENNNEHLTRLSAEGLSLFRPLLSP